MEFPKDRIPFEEAISEPLLLKKVFSELSLPQQVALKVFYGLPLKDRELEIWALFQGQVTYDPLGYPLTTRKIPYIPKEYHQAWPIFGRRSGKTAQFTGIVLPYEAALGGHQKYARPNQEIVCFLVAQNLTVARSHMGFVRETFRQSKLLEKLIKNDIAEGIELHNGIKISPASPSIKAQRGMACPVIAMDEVGFWYKDAESATPDFEVERALSWSQAQFPNYKRFGTTTPWTQEGIAYKYSLAGTEGCKLGESVDKTEFRSILVLHATTAAMENPLITKDFLEQERARDPEAFERESLARFVNSVSGFLSPTLLQKAVDIGVAERASLPRPEHPEDHTPYYIAAIDPGFRRDSFAFTIVHHNEKLGIIQDYVEEFRPIVGVPVNPVAVLDSILPIIARYKVKVVYTDQYQFESLYQLAMHKGISLENVDFTGRSKAKIFGSLQHLLNTGRLRLLDPKINVGAAETVSQLGGLEKRLTGQGNMQISAPQGRRDDMACVLALACFKAVWMLGEPGKEEQPLVVQGHVEQGLATIKKRYQEQFAGGMEDW